MDVTDITANYFSEGYNCAQSVIMAYAEEFGIDPDIAARMAGAFGGGMSRTGHTCGAVSGALMVIGMRLASNDPNDKVAKARTYDIGARFFTAFAARHSSTDCPGLLGCDIGTPEGSRTAREGGLFTTLCPLYVRDAAVIVEQLFSESAA